MKRLIQWWKNRKQNKRKSPIGGCVVPDMDEEVVSSVTEAVSNILELKKAAAPDQIPNKLDYCSPLEKPSPSYEPPSHHHDSDSHHHYDSGSHSSHDSGGSYDSGPFDSGGHHD